MIVALDKPASGKVNCGPETYRRTEEEGSRADVRSCIFSTALYAPLAAHMPCSCNLPECGEVCDSVRALKLHDAVHSIGPSSSVGAPSSSMDTAVTLEAPSFNEVKTGPPPEETVTSEKASTSKKASTATSQQAVTAKHLTPSEQAAQLRRPPTYIKAPTTTKFYTVDQIKASIASVERGGDLARYFQDPHAKRPFIFLPIAARLAPAPMTARQQGTSAERPTAPGQPPQAATSPTTASKPLDKASSSTSHSGAGYYYPKNPGARSLYYLPPTTRVVPYPTPAREWTLAEALVGGANLPPPPPPPPQTFVPIEEAIKMGVFGDMSKDPLQQVGQKSVKGEKRRAEAQRKRKERMEAIEERNKKRREEKRSSGEEGNDAGESTIRHGFENSDIDERDEEDIYDDDSDDEYDLQWDEDEEEYL